MQTSEIEARERYQDAGDAVALRMIEAAAECETLRDDEALALITRICQHPNQFYPCADCGYPLETERACPVCGLYNQSHDEANSEAAGPVSYRDTRKP